MTTLKELARNRGYDFLQNSKSQHKIVDGVVPTYAAGFESGVRHVLTLLRSPEFQTNWMKGMTGEAMARVIERVLGIESAD